MERGAESNSPQPYRESPLEEPVSRYVTSTSHPATTGGIELTRWRRLGGTSPKLQGSCWFQGVCSSCQRRPCWLRSAADCREAHALARATRGVARVPSRHARL